LARLAALAAREQHNGEEGDDDRENRGREPSGSATPGYVRLVAGVTTVGTVDVPDVPGGDSRAGRRGALLGWVVLGVLVVLLAFELLALRNNTRGGPPANAADTAAARQFAVAVTSFDHKRLQADVQRVLDLGTPTFEGTFK